MMGGTSAGKLRVFDDKVRIETPDFPGGFFLIVARAAPPICAAGERVFMDARQSSPLTHLFVPVDVGDPCLQWQAMARLAGATDRNDSWRCERVGEESVDDAVSSPTGRYHPWSDILAGSIRTSDSR